MSSGTCTTLKFDHKTFCAITYTRCYKLVRVLKQNLIMEREKIDFTDKELYYVALAFESHLNSKDTWISKSGAKVINSALKKITDNGLKRKNPKSILHPIYGFKDNE